MATQMPKRDGVVSLDGDIEAAERHSEAAIEFGARGSAQKR
ncbi:hypothetical protein [Halomicrobium katesii]|nr:hypothetical protein [Halomicrobium katesii]